MHLMNHLSLVSQLLEGRNFYRLPDHQRIIIQGTIGDDTQESRPCSWLRGKRSCDPSWRDSNSLLLWRLHEKVWATVCSSAPTLNLYVIAVDPSNTKSASLVGRVEINLSVK